ncbi:MAG: rod shape-determining protein RodA [Myxococcota bacterium]
MSPRRALADRFNQVALGIIVLLVGISLVSQHNADWYSGDDFYDSQVVWYLVGGVVFVLVSLLDLRLVERGAYLFYGLCVVGLVLTALFGTEVNNAQRWLRFGGVNVQVSEVAKLGIILALARWLHAGKERVPGQQPAKEGAYRLRELWRPALLVGVPFLLILKQPDLGTALLVVLVAGTMVLYEGIDRRSLLLVAVVGLVVVPVAWKYGGIQEYQKDRVRLWINPDWFKFDADTGAVSTARNLQSEQAVWAIGSGEFWGQGSRSGAQSRLKYLPEMHTDMIIATFAEEQGFVGCTLLLLLFWLLLVWGLRTAGDARDRFCALLAVGVVSMIGWQVFINVGMVAGLLPIVGLPLPFLSYGGSAAVTTMTGLGLLFNVALRRGRL